MLKTKKMPLAWGLFSLVVLAIWGITPGRSWGATTTWPNLLNYQGQLTDAAGTSAVADANYSILFSIYSDSSTGSPLWSETQTVATRKGLFHVVLGSVNSLASLPASNYSSDLWIGLTVGTDAEMSPRSQLLPAVYSKNSQMLGGLLPNNAANNIVVLDSAGKIPAGLVQTGSLAAPLDLNGTSSGYTLNVSNTSSSTGALGIYTSASNGIYAQALYGSGFGVWGATLPVDSASAVGVRGSANSGIGVLAQSVSGVGLSVTTQSSTIPAFIASGDFPAKFTNASNANDVALQSGSVSGDQIVNLADRSNGAGVFVNVNASGTGPPDFGISATAGLKTGIFGQTNSPSATEYGVWGHSSVGGAGIYGTGNTAVNGNGVATGVSGTSSSSTGIGVWGAGNTGVVGTTTRNSTTSFGVQGIADTAYPLSIGVIGFANSSNGTAVAGRHLGTGNGTGVRGGSPSGVGALGVYGTVSGTGGAVGTQGYASANDGYGVLGLQGNPAPVTYVAGVLGKSKSLSVGIGVRGEGNQGVYGLSGSQCGVCAYNVSTGSGLYATSPYSAIFAESTNATLVGYGIYATTVSVGDTSAAGYFLAQGTSGVTEGIYASNASGAGRAVHAVVAAGGTNFYSDASLQPAFGFYHVETNALNSNAVGVYAVENCSTCYAADFINTAAQSGTGAALNVQGRIRIQNSAGTFDVTNPANYASVTLTNPYIVSNSLVFLTSKTAPTNSLAAVTSVGAGTATITFTPALTASATYQYLIIGQ